MTNFFIKIYRFFKNKRAWLWSALIFLFIVFGYFASRIHFEEDINKLMPSSKNEDGSTKIAFADLRIKDKTYLLFQGDNVDSIINTCDIFVDSLLKRDTHKKMVENVFYRLPDELIPDMIDYLCKHLPSYIDTTTYARLDTMLTREHFLRQMEQNKNDALGEFGSAYPELIEMDPIGIRNILKEHYGAMMGNGTGSYRIVNNHILTRDSSVCVAFITPAFSATNTGQGSALFETLNKLIDQHHGNVKIYYHGTPASGFYNASTIKHDLAWTVGGSMILVLLFIFFCFRRWSAVLLLLLPVLFGTLFALAIMYFIKGELSLLALGIGSVVLGVALSYALHIITHHAYLGDAEQVLRDETKPVLLGCITTIGSFVGIIFIQSDLLRDFGMFAAFAILGTTLFSLIFLPHMLGNHNKPIPYIIERISNYPLDRSKTLLIAVILITIVCVFAFGIGGVNFDADMHNLGYQAKRVEHSEQLLRSKTFTGDKEKYFASTGKSMEIAINNFALLDHKLDSLQKLGIVKSYTHTSDIFVPLNVQKCRIEAWKKYWTKERIEKVHRLINETAPQAGLEPDGFETFFDYATAEYEPNEMYKAGIIPDGYLSTLMECSYSGDYFCFTSVRCKNDSVHSDTTDYYRICKAVTSEPNLMVLDTYYYTRDTLRQLNSDFNILQWISLLFVFIVLLVSSHFKVCQSLLGFMPIVLSWVIVLGAMVLFNMKFNLISIIISTFIFGIGVDYSIFVMSGLVSPEGNKLQYHKTAILFSAAILIITVGSMLFAQHPAIRSVGFSTLVGLVSAVVLSYVVLPAIYRRIRK